MRIRTRRAFSLLELAISLAIVTLLLSILLPALASARVVSRREHCGENQRRLGVAWLLYLADHREQFPYVPVQTGWHYGGVRFSTIDERPFLDSQRPLTPYVATVGTDVAALFRCPSDQGITGPGGQIGTGERTAFRAYGTSYRANDRLLDAQRAGIEGVRRGLRRSEIMTVPSRMVVMGTPLWYEVYEGTGRDAAWHGDPDKANFLFLDGAVRYQRIYPRDSAGRGPVVIDPKLFSPTMQQKMQ
jgi:prepilin-type N-terminal cleavage/methylation domain-containing protein/prepilin-type processing-associated H-X9-DG protein